MSTNYVKRQQGGCRRVYRAKRTGFDSRGCTSNAGSTRTFFENSDSIAPIVAVHEKSLASAPSRTPGVLSHEHLSCSRHMVAFTSECMIMCLAGAFAGARREGGSREKTHSAREELHEEDGAPRVPTKRSMSARDDTLAHHAKVRRELDRRPLPADLRGGQQQPPKMPAALSRKPEAAKSHHRG